MHFAKKIPSKRIGKGLGWLKKKGVGILDFRFYQEKDSPSLAPLLARFFLTLNFWGV